MVDYLFDYQSFFASALARCRAVILAAMEHFLELPGGRIVFRYLVFIHTGWAQCSPTRWCGITRGTSAREPALEKHAPSVTAP